MDGHLLRYSIFSQRMDQSLPKLLMKPVFLSRFPQAKKTHGLMYGFGLSFSWSLFALSFNGHRLGNLHRGSFDRNGRSLHHFLQITID